MNPPFEPCEKGVVYELPDGVHVQVRMMLDQQTGKYFPQW